MRIIQVYTYPYIKKAIIRMYGQKPFAKRNNGIGAEIMEILISERLPCSNTLQNEGLFTHIFYAQLTAYVDGQRECGRPIKTAVAAFLDKMEISEDEMSIKRALKIYDRFRGDKPKTG